MIVAIVFDRILSSPAELAVLLGVVSVLHYILAPPGARSIKPIAVTAVIAALGFVLDARTRELMCGGWLVMQVVGLADTAGRLAVWRVARNQKPERPHMPRTPDELRAAAQRFVGLAATTAIVGVLFNSAAFLTGSLFLLATGIGWYRRSVRAIL